jgi:hypothetical protein
VARRIARLLGQETESMLHTTPAGRAFAATVMVAAVAATFSFRLAPAQGPGQGPAAQEKEHSQSGAAYLPLQQDASWTWKVTQKNGDDVRTYQLVAWDFGRVPAGDGTCHQLITSDDQSPGEGVQYWSADGKGIWEHDREYLGSIRGVGKGRTRLVPAPLGVEAKWEWDSQMSYQTASFNGAEPAPRDPEQDRIHHTGELVALDEAVTVPAGKFQAAHVRIKSVCKGWNFDSTRELWFARGTGIVKEVETGPSGSIVRELTARQAGKDIADDYEAVLAKHLANSSRSSKVEWLPPGAAICYLRGRFATVASSAGNDQPTCAAFFVEDGAVVEINKDDLAFWAARAKELQAGARVRAPLPKGQARAQGFDDGMPLTFLTSTLAEIEGRRAGCTNLVGAGSDSEIAVNANPSTTCHARLRGKDAHGMDVALEATIEFAGGAVQKVKTAFGK